MVFAAFLAIVIGLAPVRAEKHAPPAAATGPVVELSPFEVTAESVEFENWNKFLSPHYVVYTDASTKEAMELVRHMEMLQQAAQDFFRRRALRLEPMIIVLPTARSDWRKIRSKGRVDWQVATTAIGESRWIILAEYDWQNDGPASLWAMAGLIETQLMNLSGPLWFERGVARFYGTLEFKGNTLTLGKQGMDAAWINRYGWMDWSRFFGVTAKSPEFRKNNRDHTLFEAQCAVLAHYVLTNADKTWLPRWLSWAACLEAGNEPTEDRFKEVFKTDWIGMQKSIDKMLFGGTYQSVTVTFPPAALQFSVNREHVTPREMRELFVLAQILNQDTKESEASLDALLAHGIKTPALREVLALACSRHDREEAELRELRELIAAGSTNPAVYARAAELRFQKAVPKLALDARVVDEAGEIRAWCKRALEIEPLYADADETLAWTEALASKVEAANLEAISRICHRLQGNAKTDAALTAYAIGRWRTGDSRQARSLAEKLKDSIYTRTSVKELVRELIARIDAAAPAR
jgi:hypothetical protein